MSVTIVLNDSLADQLHAQARVEQQPVETLAQELLAEAVRQRGLSRTWDRQNQRRVELIRKSTRRGLSVEEQTELDGLQANLDARLGHWDKELFEQLSDLEQAVQDLRRDGK
jgi:DNA-binding transcriptional MerR regulator